MNINKKILIILAILCLFFTYLKVMPLNKNVIPVQEKETIIIGVILPLTGNQSAIGESLRSALLLAKSQSKDTKHQYKLIFEDDQNNPKKAATAAQKLINVNHANILISEYANTGNVISSIANKSNIIHFGIAFDPNIAKGKMNFVHWSPPSVGVKILLSELQRNNQKNISIIKQSGQGPQSIFDEIIKQSNKYEIIIKDTQNFQSGEKDFKTLITNLKNKDSDIYVLLAFPPDIDILAKQLQEFKNKVPLTTLLYFELSQQRNLFDGQWYISQSSAHESFISSFEKFSNKKPLPGAANGFDIFNIIKTAEENIDTEINSENILKEILKIEKFNGVLGELSIPKSGIIESPASIKKIIDGKPVFSNKY